MQQAATRAQQVPSSAADGNAAPGALHDAFVINLTSSTTPVALKRPEHAGLRRFTFFVSRRREEGRERFRLHMGYFETQEEAEKLLDIVREIYPGAWAGLAPGRGLRGTPAVEQPEDVRPTAASTAAVRPSGATQADVPSRSVAPAPAARERAEAMPLARRAAQTTTDTRARATAERHAAAQSLGNVREAIDALEDSSGAAAAAAMVPAKPRVVPTLRPAHTIPTLKPLAPAPARAVATPAPRTTPRPATTAAARQAAKPAPYEALSDRAALTMLEGSARAARNARAPALVEERPCYAVQLAWSVQPIDMTRVPQLAIFNAYTLYGAQGHREGRRWYGLRLGFFTDAVSAKQVAQYVRSDFATVSVVPVSTRERDHAKGAIGSASAPKPGMIEPVPGAALPTRPGPAATTISLDEFKFIDDASEESIPKRKVAVASDALPEVAPRATRGAPGKRAVFRAGRIHAHRKAKQMTLEETLEILGANDLAVEPRKQATANGEELLPPAAPAQGKPSKLSRLFERLSERLGT